MVLVVWTGLCRANNGCMGDRCSGSTVLPGCVVWLNKAVATLEPFLVLRPVTPASVCRAAVVWSSCPTLNNGTRTAVVKQTHKSSRLCREAQYCSHHGSLCELALV